jgi:transposase
MKLHANARLSLKGRELLVDRIENAGWSLTQAAEAAGVSEGTTRKWLGAGALRAPPGWWIAPSVPTLGASREQLAVQRLGIGARRDAEVVVQQHAQAVVDK